MQRVERGQLWVMWIHAVIGGLVVLAVGLVAEFQFRELLGLPPGTVILSLLVLLAYPMTVGPWRRYRALGYALDVEELHVAWGVWIRTETVVPLRRVQHIDVSQGPVERMFGVSRLVLHTAGTLNSLVVVPGLARETAESIRDEIRARIRSAAR
jgi:hypothetical protein